MVRHGTYSCYTGGCRRLECRTAATRYQNQWRMRRMQGPTKVSSVGAMRRLRALVAIGWPLSRVAQEMGLGSGGSLWSVLYKDRKVIGSGLDSRITAIYERLSGTPGPSSRSRSAAAARGWAPPLAWGDDIDNPDATPTGIRTTDAHPYGVDIDDWWFLVRAGVDPEQAAQRCGVTLSAIERAASPDRGNRPELATVAARARKRVAA